MDQSPETTWTRERLDQTVREELQGPLLERVREAWTEARYRHDTAHPPFIVAVGTFASYARHHRIPAAAVLKALNAVLDPAQGGDPALDWDHLRDEAGRLAIRSYYRDD